MSEACCDLLGNLAAGVADEQSSDRKQWTAIEQALAGRTTRRPRRGLILAVPALAGVALWIAAGRTLSYQVEGCSLAADGSLLVPDGREGVVSFNDGTHITLDESSRSQVRPLGFWRGAQLTLHNGHADLSVVHRWGRRWEVLAGPFDVQVTGTHFEVDWAPARGRFRLEVSQGEVSVSGGPLPTRTPVHAGQRLDVDTTSAYVIMGDLGAADLAPAPPQTVPAVPAPAPERTAAASGTVVPPAKRPPRRKGASSGKTLGRGSPALAQAELPAVQKDGAGAQTEAPVPPLGDNWSAAQAAEDEAARAGPPRPHRLTVGGNGALEGGPSGPVLVLAGSETWFSGAAGDVPGHVYLEGGMLCTRGVVYALTCVNEQLPAMRCDWDNNWGVALRWYPRANRGPWGHSASSGVALEFRGKRGPYRLIAHRAGDPDARVYCVENYRSGNSVAPSQFKSECWNNAGDSLPDFGQVEFFALQFSSEQTSRTFQYCLSAINLQ
jgi:hypothetical protein